MGLVALVAGIWGACWSKLILDAEGWMLGVIVVADEVFDVGGDGNLGEQCAGGGVKATGGAVSCVVSAKNILCKDMTWGGPQHGVDPFESCVSGLIPAVSCPPCFDDPLIVSINRKRCGGAVEY